MIIDVKGCSSCPFLDGDCIVHDSRGTCTLEEWLRLERVTKGKDRHRLAVCGGESLVPLRRTPAWCPMRKFSVSVALRSRP